MSSDQQASIQQSSSTWPEPPWSGWIETTGDALLILEAAKRGIIPRVTRRLVDSERKMITSGSVFVFDEDESGIKRWTDGFYWSPSRILGNFLLYRETDKRGAGHRGARADSDPDDNPRQDGQSLSRPKADHTGMSVDKQRERVLMGSLTNSYKFKPDGLMKKTFSVTIGDVPQTTQHLISYYRIEDVESGRLRSPSSLPELASLDISPEYLDKTHFRNPPKVEIGVDGVPRYRGEADDIESSPILTAPPLSSGLPLLTAGRVANAGGNKRAGGKRFDPYAASPTTYKRARRNTKSSQPDSPATVTAEPVSPVGTAASTTPQPGPPPPPGAGLPAPIYQDQNPPANIPAQPQPPPPPGSYPAYVPAFYPGYPPPPPGHMYAAPPPPPHGPPHQVGVAYSAPPPPPGPGGTASPQVATPFQGPGAGSSGSGGVNPSGAGQYAYPGYPPPHPPPSAHSSFAQHVHSSNPSQTGHAAPPQPQPQPYYSYYPPPPMAGYAPWPVYSGYPAHQPHQPVPPHHPHAPTTQAPPHHSQPKQEGAEGPGGNS